jgi:beta-glucosidase-like glycosyl hydrolase
MVPYNYPEFINDLTNLVKNNAIPMSRIDDAVKRILRVKITMGLFENPLADDSLATKVGCQVSYFISQTNFFFFFFSYLVGFERTTLLSR